MAFTKVFLLCVGVCLLARNADAAPHTLTTATLTVAENTATIGNAVASGTLASGMISSQTNAGQFTATFTDASANIAIALSSGYTLSYEAATSYTIVVVYVDKQTPVETGTGTVTVSITDVADEFSSTMLFACLSGTSYAAGATLTTEAAISGGSAAYSIVSQTPASNLLEMTAASGLIKVAASKTISATLTPYVTANIKLINTAATTTSEATIVIAFGCGSAAGAAAHAAVAMFTVAMAMLASYLS